MTVSTILGKYCIEERLGAGAYGLVYRVSESSDVSTQYAVKLERASKKRLRPPSEHEANVMRLLSDPIAHPGIPRVIEYGYDKQRHSKALVIDLLGNDLQTLRAKCGNRFSIKTTLLLASRLIPIIKHIHTKSFVHRDIKPGNMLLGVKGSENTVHLVDFGIARRYRNPRNGVHMPFLEGKSVVGTIRFASLNTHLGIAQTRRDDIECLAYSLLDCLRDLPWGRIVGGSPKQFEERVREKKRNWSPDRLCAGIPDAFKAILVHARSLKFDEEPNYQFLLKTISEEIERGGHSINDAFDWSHEGNVKGDYAPPFENRVNTMENTETLNLTCPPIQPGDFIKLRLLAAPTVLFSGRFSSIETDASFWHSPSLNDRSWQFPFRPAIVASVEHDEVARRGKKGMKLTVYPLISRTEGLDGLPESLRKRFVPLGTNAEGVDDRAPAVEPSWQRANTYVYNTCVTLTVSLDPAISFKSDHFTPEWRLKGSDELKKLTEQLQLVRPPLEAGQPVQPEDRDETIVIKTNKRHILQTVFAEVDSLTSTDLEGRETVWTGRNGWLKEFNKIGKRLELEGGGSESSDSSEEYDSDYIYDSISPPGERRASCTVNLDPCAYE